MGFVANKVEENTRKHAKKWFVANRVRLVFFASLLALTLVGLLAYRSTISLMQHAAAVNKTHQVRAQIAVVLDCASDFHRAARQYVLFGNARDRGEFDRAQTLLPGELTRLQMLSRAHPALSRTSERFARMVEFHQENARRQVTRRETQIAPLTGGEEMRLLRGEAESLDSLREFAGQLDKEATLLLDPQNEATRLVASQTLETILLSGFVAVCLLAAAFLAIDRDISRRRVAEVRLAQSERRFRALIENASDMIVLATARGEITYVSPAVRRITGFEAERLVGGDIFTPTHPDDRAALRESFEGVLSAPKGHPTAPVIFRTQRADGQWRWMETVAVNELSEPGIEAVVATTRDVTERKEAEAARLEAEAAVRASEARLAEAQKIAGIGAWESLPNNAEFLWDVRCYEIFGFNVDDGHPNRETVYARFLPHEREQILSRVQQVRETGERQEFEMGVLYPSGELHHAFVIADRREGGPVSGALVGTVQDITERKQAEQERENMVRDLTVSEHRLRGLTEELARSNRDLDDFATAASHDLQEPLRKIQAFSDLIARRAESSLDTTTLDYLDRMQKSARRLETLVSDLLALSRVNNRPQQPGRTVSLCAVTQAVVGDLEAELAEAGGQVILGPLPTVVGDPAQMRQLLQNLVANSIKFRRDGEPLRVDIWAEPVTTPGSAAFGSKVDPEESWVRLHVSDNGIGFQPSHADRIFKPFERLESRSKYAGNGIGLALCRRIAERHGGAIVAEGRPGEGATFTVALPCSGPLHACE